MEEERGGEGEERGGEVGMLGELWGQMELPETLLMWFLT